MNELVEIFGCFRNIFPVVVFGNMCTRLLSNGGHLFRAFKKHLKLLCEVINVANFEAHSVILGELEVFWNVG